MNRFYGGFRRSFRRYVHSDESNLASARRRVGVRKQFRELIYSWHVVHIRGQNQGVVRQTSKLAFHAGKTYSRHAPIFSLSFSHFLSPLIFSIFEKDCDNYCPKFSQFKVGFQFWLKMKFMTHRDKLPVPERKWPVKEYFFVNLKFLQKDEN